MKKVKEVCKKKNPSSKQTTVWWSLEGKGWGVGEGEEGKGAIDGDGRVDLGWQTHSTIYR